VSHLFLWSITLFSFSFFFFCFALLCTPALSCWGIKARIYVAKKTPGRADTAQSELDTQVLDGDGIMSFSGL
jgi:hypothetical protein